MKKLLSHFVLFSLLLFSACQSSSSNNPAAKDSVVKPVDTATTQPATTTHSSVTPEDPDTTDASPVSAYIPNTYRKDAVELARSALRDKYQNELKLNQIDEASRKFSIYEYDLNNDGRKEIFVGTSGSYFCGSGGCTILLLDPEGKLITTFTVSSMPLVIGHERTNGWLNLYIKSNALFHVIKYNKGKYPSNPSIEPASKLTFSDDMPRVLDVDHVPYPKFSY